MSIISVGQARFGLPYGMVMVPGRLEGASKAKFWKDGYTDVAGCFDYAAVSGGRDAVRAVTSFAVLIVDDSGTKAARTGSGSTSDSLGAAVRLLGPVAQT